MSCTIVRLGQEIDGLRALDVMHQRSPARQAVEWKDGAASMARTQTHIVGREAENAATIELLGGDSFENRFSMLERDEQIEPLLQNLKQDFKKDLKQPEAPTAYSQLQRAHSESTKS